jgi:hypothetical protein
MIVKVLFNDTQTMLKDRGLESGGKVQKVIDSEVLRRSDPYVPFRSGALKKSGTLGTKIGSGEVVYNAIYARKQYYHNSGSGKQGTAKGGLRGKFWFERMKTDHLADILKTANETAGGK